MNVSAGGVGLGGTRNEGRGGQVEKRGRGGSGQMERKVEGREGRGAFGECGVEGDMYDMCV